MKPNNAGQNQGEGDKASARQYNRHVGEFVAEGKVEPAAADAKAFVEGSPGEAERAEQAAKRGPRGTGGTRVSLDELLAKGRTVIDRVRPMVERAASRIRTRIGRK